MQQNNKPNDSAELRYQLHSKALDLFAAGEFIQGTRILQQLLRLNPKEPLVDHIKGFLLSELGLQNEAIPLLRRAVRLLPPNKPEPRVTLAIALMREGNLPEAEAILEQSLAANPECSFTLTNLANCLLAREKSPERAEQLLRKADLLTPNDQSTLANLGHALAVQGKTAEADKTLLRAIRLAPHSDVVKQIAAHHPHLTKDHRRPGNEDRNLPKLN